MDDRIQPDDPRYLERTLAHVERVLAQIVEREQRNHDDLEAIKRVLADKPSKGEFLELGKAIKIVDERLTSIWQMVKNNANRLAYIGAVAAATAGAVAKNANLRDLLPF